MNQTGENILDNKHDKFRENSPCRTTEEDLMITTKTTHAIKVTRYKFNVGDKVQRVTTDTSYKFPGEIVARFYSKKGYERYVVECLVEGVNGCMHIFSEKALEHKPQ